MNNKFTKRELEVIELAKQLASQDDQELYNIQYMADILNTSYDALKQMLYRIKQKDSDIIPPLKRGTKRYSKTKKQTKKTSLTLQVSSNKASDASVEKVDSDTLSFPLALRKRVLSAKDAGYPKEQVKPIINAYIKLNMYSEALALLLEYSNSSNLSKKETENIHHISNLLKAKIIEQKKDKNKKNQDELDER